jgi:hypothetical protein
MEAKLVPERGYELELLHVLPIRGGGISGALIWDVTLNQWVAGGPWGEANIFTIAPRAGGNADDGQGISLMSVGGTASFHVANNTSYVNSLPARRFSTSAAANQDAGFRGGAGQVSTNFIAGGANAAGFEVIIRATPMIAVVGSRLVLGMSGGATTPCTSEPSVALNTVFYGWDSTDSNWQLMHNDGAGVATKINTLVPFVQEIPVQVHIRARNGVFSCQLLQLAAGGIRTLLHSAALTLDIPAAGTVMGINTTIGNAALGIIQELRYHHIAGRFGL